MKSLHQSAQLANVLAQVLNTVLSDYKILEIYSSTKTELIFKTNHPKYHTLVFNFSTDNLIILFPELQTNRPRLAIAQFKQAWDAKIVAVHWIKHERIIAIKLTQNTCFYLFFYGRRSEIVYQKGPALKNFRSKIEIPIPPPNEINYDVSNWEQFWEQNKCLVYKERKEPFQASLAQNHVTQTLIKGLEKQEMALVLTEKLPEIDAQLENIHSFGIQFLRNYHQQRKEKQDAAATKQHQKLINQRLAAAQNKWINLSQQNHFQTWGDVIMSNLGSLNPKLKKQMAMNWVLGKEMELEINPEKSLIENANKYYQKAKNAHKETAFLKVKITQLEKQLLAPVPLKNKVEKTVSVPYYQFFIDNMEIRVGKSAEKNDELIKNHCHKNDLWLHAKDVSGSHVIVRNPDKKPITKQVLEYAAGLAAKYSKSKHQTLAAVSYTERKYVRKNKKMLPGQVRLEQETIILVKPME